MVIIYAQVVVVGGWMRELLHILYCYMLTYITVYVVVYLNFELVMQLIFMNELILLAFWS